MRQTNRFGAFEDSLDPYEVLEVSRRASDPVIEVAYKKLATLFQSPAIVSGESVRAFVSALASTLSNSDAEPLASGA